MKLDSDEQKNLLLQIISSATLQGPYAQMKEAVGEMDKLHEAVKAAEIEKEA
jgi:hypothetical protein